MKSVTTRRFRESYAALPDDVRRQARRAWQLFRQDPSHPGLKFKKIEGRSNVYSVQVGLGYRAVGIMDGSLIVWSWIGTHSDYDRLF
jgi:hypothetical protein